MNTTIKYGILFLLLFAQACQEHPTIEIEQKNSKAANSNRLAQWEFDRKHDPKTNTVPSDRLLKAKAYAERLRRQKDAILGIYWQERGPNNVGGRTRSLFYDLNDRSGNTVFAGSVSGGLWKTTDINAASPNWTLVSGFWENLAVNCMVQDQNNPNRIFIGTGEGWYGSNGVQGQGIWYSDNSGSTFVKVSGNSFDNTNINDIAMTNNGEVFATIRNDNDETQGGIWYSKNGFNDWQQVFPTNGTEVRGADLEISANGDIYASIGANDNGINNGIYKLTKSDLDASALNNWTILYNASTNETRIELACAPSDANRVYALVENVNSNIIGSIRRTTNGGNDGFPTIPTPIWLDNTSMQLDCANTTTDWTRDQGWFDLIAAVDPLDANTVYIGAVDLFKTTNGGTNWTQVSNNRGGLCGFADVHADQHAIVFNPNDNTELLIGNDGGVYQSTDSGNSYSFKSNNYNVTQFYACDINNDANADLMLAGAQDNGTQYFDQTGLGATNQVRGADGAFCHFGPNNSYQIRATQNHNYQIIYNPLSGSSAFVNSNTITDDDSRFINPTDLDTINDILYIAGGGDYHFISFSLSSDGSTVNTNTVIDINIPQFSGQDVTAVTVSPNLNNVVYFGLANGDIVRVNNANNASSASGLVMRNSSITGTTSCIEIDPNNESHILVTYSNYGVNSIWETTNGGADWTSVEGNLPDMPVSWAIFNPEDSNQALLATELGVWTTDNLNGNSTMWQPSNGGLANVRTEMLKVRPVDNLVVAATHGRGLFTTDYFTTCFTDNLELSQNISSYTVYRTTGTIDAKNTISQNATAAYISAISVDLLEGFDAESGSDFEAGIADCVPLPSNLNDDEIEIANRSFGQSTGVDFTISPNPFFYHTILQYKVAKQQEIQLFFSNTMGEILEIVKPLSTDVTGTHQIEFINENYPSGIYFFTLEINGERLTKKILIQE